MPSPASRTVPVSWTETFWSKLWISLRMIWLISSARICMALVFQCGSTWIDESVEELAAQVGQLGPDAAVQHQVAHLRDDTADQRRIDGGFDDDLLARAL